MGSSIIPKNLVQVEPQEDQDFTYALRLVGGIVLPMAMQSALDLGIFDILAEAGDGAKLSALEIATRIKTDNPDAPMMLDRILRLLVSHSVLSCSMGDHENDPKITDNGFIRLYGLAPVSIHFVKNQDGVSLAPMMALIQDKVFLDSWFQLKDAVLEGGIPFNRVHGMHAFEYPGVDQRFNQVFNKGMLNYATIVLKKVLESYKGFEELNFKQLVDVGGGLGITISLITSEYPNIKGINFDLPHVIEHAPHYPGVEHVGGDMFNSVPKGDNIFMKWILHDWSDEACVKLLKNCYSSIPDDGKVIVMDSIVSIMPETNPNSKTIHELDVAMMTQNPGGKERTQREFIALATAAGFSGVRFVCPVSFLWVMEFFK